jgi:hypothetical protein
MYDRANIGWDGCEKFMLMFNPRTDGNGGVFHFDTFEKAYLKACNELNWKTENIKINIHPDFVNNAITNVHKSKREHLLRYRFETSLEQYNKAKAELDECLNNNKAARMFGQEEKANYEK